MSTHPDYGQSFSLWRTHASEPWQAYTQHAFVEGLRDGTLPRPAFLHYLVQDYVYLIHYARAWALAVVKAETLDEMKTAAATVDPLVNYEMRLHVETCAREGISEAQLFAAAEEPENLAYTRYVLEAGFSGDFLDLMAALAPCVFGYGEIGMRLAKEGVPNNPYQEWIDTYASDEFQNACKNVGCMLDGAIALRLGNKPQESPRWQRLNERFTIATKLEVNFWQMGLNGA